MGRLGNCAICISENVGHFVASSVRNCFLFDEMDSDCRRKYVEFNSHSNKTG